MYQFNIYQMNLPGLQLDIVKKLLELEADSGAFNQQNGHGATALHTALQLQHLDVFDRLLEAGADPTIKVRSLCIITLQYFEICSIVERNFYMYDFYQLVRNTICSKVD